MSAIFAVSESGCEYWLMPSTDREKFDRNYWKTVSWDHHSQRCGVGAGWGPWGCGEMKPCEKHRCQVCGAPGTRLCSSAGAQFVCGIPTCAEHHCPKHYPEKNLPNPLRDGLRLALADHDGAYMGHLPVATRDGQLVEAVRRLLAKEDRDPA